jgi:quercetin dioxygenase-like cupin family protein
VALNNPILDATLNGINLDEIKREMGPAPWTHTVVLADHITGVVICQIPGQENDRHCHDFDEWWIVLEGEIDWIMEGREDEPVQAKAGHFVCAPAMTFHTIVPKGDGPSVRVAITLPGSEHLHERPAKKAIITVER